VPADHTTEPPRASGSIPSPIPLADKQPAAACLGRLSLRCFERARTRLGPLFVCLSFGVADWVLLRALPVFRISFSTEIWFPVLASALVRLTLLATLLGAAPIVRRLVRRSAGRPYPRLLLVLYLIAQSSLTLVQVYAYVVEPLWVETTELSLAFERLDGSAPPVRIVLLSDIHIERASYREAHVVREVNALEPDLIVLAGDYLNLSRLTDPVSAQQFGEFAGQLRAPYGIYAVRGSVESSPAFMEKLVAGTPIVWLEQETVTLDVRGQRIALVGVACSHARSLDSARLAQAYRGVPEDTFTLLLYHSPDLMPQAARRQIDLYLTGHTHGGQISLPFYGAVVTGSVYGKRYEAGLYRMQGTTMYVTRGLGFEGGPAPRARFFARPEIVGLELHGEP
jgi:predicted MPP superfamily phosphohydrolase